MLERTGRPGLEAYAPLIDERFRDAAEALAASRRGLTASIAEAGRLIAACLQRDGRLLLCGNGGSAADAQHFAGELVGRFKRPGRGGLFALALTADTSILTAWANDVGFEEVFARQVEAYGRPGDVLVGISTSGRSRNVVRAFELARAGGLTCIGLLGGSGGELGALSDLAIVVPSADTQHIQEVQIVVIHILCELVEAELARLESEGMAEEDQHDARILSLSGRSRPLAVPRSSSTRTVR